MVIQQSEYESLKQDKELSQQWFQRMMMAEDKVAELEAQLSAQADPFMPSPEEWEEHPDALAHSVDKSGRRTWWLIDAGLVLSDEQWCADEVVLMVRTNNGLTTWEEGGASDWNGRGDWRNSLRHRPE